MLKEFCSLVFGKLLRDRNAVRLMSVPNAFSSWALTEPRELAKIKIRKDLKKIKTPKSLMRLTAAGTRLNLKIWRGMNKEETIVY